MWYNEIPSVSVWEWLNGVLRLFETLLYVIIGQPLLRVFIGLLVFMITVAVVQMLLHAVRR